MIFDRNDRRSDKEDEIRVTDRRRIYLDDEKKPEPAERNQEPNLKPSYVEELEARTAAAEKLVQEVQTRFEAAKAQMQRDVDETRQRLNRAADERAEQKNANFIAALLPVLDNLQRATEVDESADSPAILEGVKRIADGFEQALRAAGVEPVTAIGQDFDPECHEAVDTVDAGPEMEGKVIAEYTRGYRMGDRLLRPARVQVGAASVKKSVGNPGV
ncbi:MAG TPA: nucleotide exchange factor GrpE [Pyrinomonadaceae bacterium]